MNTKITRLISGLIFIASGAAFAAQTGDKIDWKACDKEIKQYKCKGSDRDVWGCLEKYDDKLSKTCQGAHEKGDKLFKGKK